MAVPLHYATPSHQPRRSALLPTLWVGVAAGVCSFLFADWYAYVYTPTPVPKFEMPFAWKVTESLLVGVFAAAALTVTQWLLRRAHGAQVLSGPPASSW